MPVWLQTALLLACSNLFMTFAWYGHLKTLNSKPWIIAALISWGIALFEYLLQVPANRIGYTELSVGQLKIMQEVITLAIFVPFSVYFMQQPLSWTTSGPACACSARCTSSSAPEPRHERSRAIRLEVSQRPPPIACTSA